MKTAVEFVNKLDEYIKLSKDAKGGEVGALLFSNAYNFMFRRRGTRIRL